MLKHILIFFDLVLFLICFVYSIFWLGPGPIPVCNIFFYCWLETNEVGCPGTSYNVLPLFLHIRNGFKYSLCSGSDVRHKIVLQ